MEFLLQNDIIIKEKKEKKEKEKEKKEKENEKKKKENEKKKKENEKKKKEKEQPLVLDITESINWIKDSEIKFNRPQFKNPKYKGPTYTSNWVTNKLCMSSYPKTKNEVCQFINAGINTFVCLNGSDKKEFYKYEDDLPKNINYIHEPIEDMNITTDDKIISLCQNIVHRIKVKGEIILVHCAGGHGRTGTVVGCVLYLLYKLSIEQILDYLQFTHDQRDGCCFSSFYYTKHLHIKNPYKNCYALGQVPVPQIETQVEQIKRILVNFSYEVVKS
jgi:protein-tyrosine phosphatase